MHPRFVFVALILAVIALGGVAAYQACLLHSQPPTPQPVTSTRWVTQEVSRATAALPATPSPLPEAPNEAYAPPGSFNWRNVETADYRAYIENLRAVGCPEQTVRDIVIADLNRLYGSRRAALLTQGKTPKFWQAPEPISAEQSAAQMQQLEALQREKTEAIRGLLGIDPATEQRKLQEGVTYPGNRLGNLPPEKQDQVSFIRETFNEQWNQAGSADAQSGKSPDEISAELRRLDEERLAKLAQILTPEELREHELQTSWTAIELRHRLASFQPSEAEFLKIYELQKAFDNEYVHYFHERTDEAALTRKMIAQQELDARLKAALGEQRYAEYLQARSGMTEHP